MGLFCSTPSGISFDYKERDTSIEYRMFGIWINLENLDILDIQKRLGLFWNVLDKTNRKKEN